MKVEIKRNAFLDFAHYHPGDDKIDDRAAQLNQRKIQNNVEGTN